MWIWFESSLVLLQNCQVLKKKKSCNLLKIERCLWRRKDHQVALCVHVLRSFPSFFSIFVFREISLEKEAFHKNQSVPPARPPPEQLNNVSVFNEAMQNFTSLL